MYSTKIRNVNFKIKKTDEVIEGSEWEIDTGRGSPFCVFYTKKDIETEKHYLSFEIIEVEVADEK